MSVNSMLGGMTVEDTAPSSVCSNNEVYQEMNVQSEERIVIRDASKYIRGIGFIYDQPEIVTNNIEYEDDEYEYENMERKELLQHLARRAMTCDKNVPRHDEKKKKRYVALKMTASNRNVRNPKPSITKKPCSAKNTADPEYVPLAIREKKRDEYIWF